MTTAVQTARAVRDATIRSIACAARELLLSEEVDRTMEKAVEGLDRMLEAAVVEIEGLSSSNRGYAHRDLEDDVQTNLARARGFIDKLKLLHGPQASS